MALHIAWKNTNEVEACVLMLLELGGGDMGGYLELDVRLEGVGGCVDARLVSWRFDVVRCVYRMSASAHHVHPKTTYGQDGQTQALVLSQRRSM